MGLEGDDEILDEEEDEELNWMAIIIAAVVVLALIGGAVWFFFIREVPEEGDKVELPKWEKPDDLVAENVNDFLNRMRINPANSRGRHFLVVKLDFALNDVSVVSNEVYGKSWRLAQVKNTIIDVFSSYTLEELKLPKYKEEARTKLWEELNGLVGWTRPAVEQEEGMAYDPPPIKAIYFSEYILLQ